jgi:hypothetical protein
MAKDEAREQRLAEALRENLKRRKAQGRAAAEEADRGSRPDRDEAKPQS